MTYAERLAAMMQRMDASGRTCRPRASVQKPRGSCVMIDREAFIRSARSSMLEGVFVLDASDDEQAVEAAYRLASNALEMLHMARVAKRKERA